jgi:SAM-dependent methyltransferase
MSMLPKPTHLAPEYGAQFQDAAIVAAYHHRPPYPAEVFALLAGLITDPPRHVLDVGCGTGYVARPLAALVDRVDALDPSAAMLAAGQQAPGGDAPNLRWILGYAEDALLDPPYALITAGASLHWMEWAVVMPRFRASLTPHGYLAIINDGTLPGPWRDALQPIIDRYSTNRLYQPYNLIDELTHRGLFEPVGEQRTPPHPFPQPIAAYIESFHARNGLSRDRMPPAAAAAFDAEAQATLAELCPDGSVPLQVYGEVVWGRPLAP